MLSLRAAKAHTSCAFAPVLSIMLLLRFCPTTIYTSNYRGLFPQFTRHVGLNQNCAWTSCRTLRPGSTATSIPIENNCWEFSMPRVWPSNIINNIPTPYVAPNGGRPDTTWDYDGQPGDFNPAPTAALIDLFQQSNQTGNLFMYNEVRFGR